LFFSANYSADFFDILNCSDFIVAVDYGNKDGFFFYRFFELLEIYKTFIVNIKVGYLPALFFQPSACLKNTGMFDFCCDYVVFLSIRKSNTLYCKIV